MITRIICFLLLLSSFSVVMRGQDPEILKKAQEGDANAQFRLAMDYYHDDENEECARWLRKAAENGSIQAQHDMMYGLRYGGYYGLDKNHEEMVHWATRLANIDITKEDSLSEYEINCILNAQFQLAWAYDLGLGGLEKNIQEYLRWEKKAAFNGYYPSSMSLGLYYENIDKQEAIYWLKKCMDQKWAETGEEDEFVLERLRKLGVYYHPEEHVGHNHGESVAVSNSSSSSNSNQVSNNNQGNQVREYIETVPIQVWQPCGGCNGSGQCHICYGSGWTLSANGNRSTCWICHGTGKCTHCAGHGGQNVVRYEQRTVYR